jgi:hypothetical protein
MATDKFVLDDSMAVGWAFTKKRYWSFLGMIALSAFLLVLPHLASWGAEWTLGKDNMPGMMAGLGLSLAGTLLSIFMQLGVINIQLRIVEDLPFSSSDLWTPAGKFWAYVGYSILYCLMVGFGIVCFIVPGIILAITFLFGPYFIVKHRCGPIQALKASAALTEGAKWELFFLALVLGIIEGVAWLFGLITLGFSIFTAMMFSKLTLTYVFEQLLAKTPDSQLPFATARASTIDSGEPPMPKF